MYKDRLKLNGERIIFFISLNQLFSKWLPLENKRVEKWISEAYYNYIKEHLCDIKKIQEFKRK